MPSYFTVGVRIYNCAYLAYNRDIMNKRTLVCDETPSWFGRNCYGSFDWTPNRILLVVTK